MAKKRELTHRVITGVFGAALFLSTLIFGGDWAAALITITLSVLMAFEWGTLSYRLPDQRSKRIFFVILTWFSIVLFQLMPEWTMEILALAFLITGFFFLRAHRPIRAQDRAKNFQELQATTFGIFFVILLPSFFPLLYREPNGLHWTILFTLIIWATDIGAFFGGIKFGKTPLYPAASPKKTVEGAIGGFLTAILVALLYVHWNLPGTSLLAILFTSVAVSGSAQIGDLVESVAKRASDKKDSGSLLPGHGGFLDRFDGFVYGIPIMYLCVSRFM